MYLLSSEMPHHCDPDRSSHPRSWSGCALRHLAVTVLRASDVFPNTEKIDWSTSLVAIQSEMGSVRISPSIAPYSRTRSAPPIQQHGTLAGSGIPCLRTQIER